MNNSRQIIEIFLTVVSFSFLGLLSGCSQSESDDGTTPPQGHEPVVKGPNVHQVAVLEPLKLEAQSGQVPFTVRTLNTGRDGECVRPLRFSSHGIGIDWGDGSSSPNHAIPFRSDETCPPFGVHTYTVPGIYRIVVQYWSVGPTDQIIPGGERSTTITVTGEPINSSTELSLRDAGQNSGGEHEFPYDVKDFYITHKMSARAVLNLRLELLDGNVLAESSSGPIAYDGTTRFYVGMTNERLAMTRDVLVGLSATPAVLHITATTPEGTVLTKKRLNITLNAQSLRIRSLCPRVQFDEEQKRKITLILPHRRSNAMTYRINWGDGQTDEKSKPSWKRTSWPVGADSAKFRLEHIYAQPGSYQIELRYENERNTKETDTPIDLCNMQIDVG